MAAFGFDDREKYSFMSKVYPKKRVAREMIEIALNKTIDLPLGALLKKKKKLQQEEELDEIEDEEEHLQEERNGTQHHQKLFTD